MIRNIFFDFDGVIIDSMPIRNYGFRKIFENFDSKKVDELIEYHQYNAGLSRFHKIKYFYGQILNKEISEKEINDLANRFSVIMKKELINKKYLIQETVKFIKNNYKKYNLHIVSGSEESELIYLCEKLDISKYFKTINGSPIHKNNLVKNIIQNFNYKISECIMIGDSINDYYAAQINGIHFYGYNNTELKNLDKYIDSFRGLYI